MVRRTFCLSLSQNCLNVVALERLVNFDQLNATESEAISYFVWVTEAANLALLPDTTSMAGSPTYPNSPFFIASSSHCSLGYSNILAYFVTARPQDVNAMREVAACASDDFKYVAKSVGFGC